MFFWNYFFLIFFIVCCIFFLENVLLFWGVFVVFLFVVVGFLFEVEFEVVFLFVGRDVLFFCEFKLSDIFFLVGFVSIWRKVVFFNRCFCFCCCSFILFFFFFICLRFFFNLSRIFVSLDSTGRLLLLFFEELFVVWLGDFRVFVCCYVVLLGDVEFWLFLLLIWVVEFCIVLLFILWLCCM